jgi:hypothetical protein
LIEFGNMDGNLKPLTIVGVVGDVRARGLNLPPSGVIYVDFRQRGMKANSSPTIVMRSAAPAGEIVSAARGIFHDLAPDVPVKFSTFADEMGGWLADRRFLLLLVIRCRRSGPCLHRQLRSCGLFSLRVALRRSVFAWRSAHNAATYCVWSWVKALGSRFSARPSALLHPS